METKHKLFKVNQNAIITNEEGSVLILKRAGGWGLPGGRLEDDNTPQEGLVREILEETGIKGVENVQIVSADLSDTKETYLVYFLCRVSGLQKITLSNEHQEYVWVTKNTLDDYGFEYLKTKEKIREALAL